MTSSTPRTTTDPEGDKRRAVRHAASRARRVDEAERTFSLALVFAHDQGASLRELAEATGRPHMTVKRLIERARGADQSE